jgi:hypothetical protein
MAVQLTSTYIHAIDGRLRVKVTAVKGSPAKAMEIEGRLRAFGGVRHVKANPTTGNVLVLYTPELIARGEILAALELPGSMPRSDQGLKSTGAQSQVRQTLFETLAESLVRSTMEIALQRLVSALI